MNTDLLGTTVSVESECYLYTDSGAGPKPLDLLDFLGKDSDSMEVPGGGCVTPEIDPHCIEFIPNPADSVPGLWRNLETLRRGLPREWRFEATPCRPDWVPSAVPFWGEKHVSQRREAVILAISRICGYDLQQARDLLDEREGRFSSIHVNVGLPGGLSLAEIAKAYFGLWNHSTALAKRWNDSHGFSSSLRLKTSWIGMSEPERVWYWQPLGGSWEYLEKLHQSVPSLLRKDPNSMLWLPDLRTPSSIRDEVAVKHLWFPVRLRCASGQDHLALEDREWRLEIRTFDSRSLTRESLGFLFQGSGMVLDTLRQALDESLVEIPRGSWYGLLGRPTPEPLALEVRHLGLHD